MAKNPRTPFPSFTLALSQAAGDNIGIQERNVGPQVDLMVSHQRRVLCRR